VDDDGPDPLQLMQDGAVRNVTRVLPDECPERRAGLRYPEAHGLTISILESTIGVPTLYDSLQGCPIGESSIEDVALQ
jgi:hypothetical protein